MGGPEVHARNGVVDNLVTDEPAAFAEIRRFLSYLPPNVWELPPCTAAGRPGGPPRRGTDRDRAAQPAQALRHAARDRAGAGRGLVLRDRPALRAGHDHRPRPALGPTRRRSRQRLLAPGRRHDRSGLPEDTPLHRALRHVPLAHREPGRRARLHAGNGGGEGRYDPLRRCCRVSGGELGGALGVGDRAQGTRRRRGRALRPGRVRRRLGPRPRWARSRSRGGVAVAFGRQIAKADDPKAERERLEEEMLERQSPAAARRRVSPSTTSSTRAKLDPCSATGSPASSRCCPDSRGQQAFLSGLSSPSPWSAPRASG